MTNASAEQAPRRLRVPVLVALLSALLVAGGGAAYISNSELRYEATASMVVLPKRGLEPSVAASFFDTLSQGQVVGTFAELLRVRNVGESPAGTRVDVRAVPNTAVINLVGSGSTPSNAGRAAELAAQQAQALSAELVSPFRLTPVDAAPRAGQRVGPGLTALLGAVLLIALIAGIATWQLALAFGQPRQGRTPVSSQPGAGFPPTGGVSTPDAEGYPSHTAADDGDVIRPTEGNGRRAGVRRRTR